jgi:hypothetical protein
MKISFAEGTICNYLQAAYLVMMIVDPNFRIKCAGKNSLKSFEQIYYWVI